MSHPGISGSPPPSYIDVATSAQYWDPNKHQELEYGKSNPDQGPGVYEQPPDYNMYKEHGVVHSSPKEVHIDSPQFTR